LHRIARDLDLDFFITFSSIASILGNAGQANYSAANAVLDRLSWLRASEGQPAQAINWGPWSEIGMSAAAQGQRTFEFGVGQISPARGIAALTALAQDRRTESIVVPMDWSAFLSRVPGAARDPFLTSLRSAAEPAGQTGRKGGDQSLAVLLAAPPEDRQGLLESFVRGELAKVLQLAPDDLPLDQPLNTVGLDSLMALELKNRVEGALAITLPIVALIQGPTVTQLAEDLLVRIEAASAGGLSPAIGDPAGAAGGDVAAESPVAEPGAGVSAADIEQLLAPAARSPRL
jgi:acyl carrier protein